MSIRNQAFPVPIVFHMEFQSSPQPTMDMNMNPSSEYEGIDEVEDDVFYADIRRQILLLTADDDEDYQETSKPRSNRAIGSISSSLEHGSYFNWWESENTNSVPTWLANLWRNGNASGTGVFIPHIDKSRGRLRPGGMNRRKIYRPVNQTMNKQNTFRVHQSGNSTSQSKFLNQ